MFVRKVLIVEGKSDKERLEKIINDEVEIICTNGTVSYDYLEQLITEYSDDDLIILVDSDKSGESLRRQLKRAFPTARNCYVNKKYREVATTPFKELAIILLNENIAVDKAYLI